MYLKYRPSLIAVSALFLALHTTQQRSWPPQLAEASGMTLDDLKECIQELHKIHIKVLNEGFSLRAVREKYAQEKYFSVSKILPASSVL